MDSKRAMNGSPFDKRIKIVFVLGGPGSGKSTQCTKIVEHFGYTHFSSGDLLRAECKSGSKNGTMIQNLMKEGKLVDSSIIVQLIQKAMLESKNDKFLIDGFPRNEENRIAFEKIVNIEPELLLFLDCPESELEKRLLSRNQGREDDSVETIKKRFKVFTESTLPVVNYYEQRGKVRKVNAAKPPEEVFKDIKAIFSSFQQGNHIGYQDIAIEGKPEHSASLIERCLPFLCCLSVHERK
ncbi:UMP-CMP kinase 3-like isoform X2 [Carex rostrata]